MASASGFGVGDKVWVYGPDEGELQVLVDDVSSVPIHDDEGEPADYKNDKLYCAAPNTWPS